MSHPFAHLLQPGRIGTLALRNRMIMAPMGSNFAEADGFCGERIQAYYEERAKGGAGLLTMGVCAIAYPAGTGEPFQVGVSRDDFIPGLAQVAQRVHAHGAKIAMQLQHGGKNAALDRAQGREIWVPSMPKAQMPAGMDAITPEELSTFVGIGPHKPRIRVMDKADIAHMVELFAAAAARAQKAGFDAVEIHGAHNYILAGFLSPYYNQRNDEYGGPLENRARLLLETIAAVKARVGPDFPVWVRLDAAEMHTPGGIDLESAIATAELCEQAGVDAISVSAYAMLVSGTAFTDAPIPQQPQAFISNAAAIKRAVNVPIICSGRLEPEDADRAIAGGEIDFLAIGRKLLADPELPIKLVENRVKDIRPCIYCYACVSEIFVNRCVKCAVNPRTGHEYKLVLQKAMKPKHIVVIGAGPGGMEAARVAALRGHRVTLLERSDRLGGSLFFAGLAYPENSKLLDYLIAQIQQLPVNVRLKTDATPALLRQLQADEVVVAVGAQRPSAEFPGALQRHVWTGDELRRLMSGDGANEIAKNKLGWTERVLFKVASLIGLTRSASALQKLSHVWMPLGKKVVVVGGGLVGLELAEFLLARGRHVTVLEPSTHAGRELSIVRRWRVLDAVRSHGELFLQAQVQRITANSVEWTDRDGHQQAHHADSVVLALGSTPDKSLSKVLGSENMSTHFIGDCSNLGYIEGAIKDGYTVGSSV